MQISSRLTIALQMLICMETFKAEKVTSDFMADSIGVNPVVIRRLLSQLKEAGLVRVKRGPGGASLAKPLAEISFLSVYQAVEPVLEKSLFSFHTNPNPACPVGRNIHQLLDGKLAQAQAAFEAQLAQLNLVDLNLEEEYLAGLS